MVQLAEWQDRFAAVGVSVAAMTYDDRSMLAAFHEAHGLRFPLLQDEHIRHFDAYGVRNEQYDKGHQGYGIPHPGVLFIDPQGVVQMKFAVAGYRERPPLEDIYEAIGAALVTTD